MLDKKVVALYPLSCTIQSIKLGDAIKITYTKESKSGFTNTHADSCLEEARPEFYDAIAQLIPHALELCELHGLIEPSGIRVTSISMSSGKLKISMCRDLGEGTQWNFSTPAVKEEDISEKLDAALELVSEEANKYIQGQRAQLNLLDGAA
jgi:hypothetical protein